MRGANDHEDDQTHDVLSGALACSHATRSCRMLWDSPRPSPRSCVEALVRVDEEALGATAERSSRHRFFAGGSRAWASRASAVSSPNFSPSQIARIGRRSHVFEHRIAREHITGFRCASDFASIRRASEETTTSYAPLPGRVIAMPEDIRELRDKLVALTTIVESRRAKYRLLEMEERLTDLLQTAPEPDRSRDATPSS